MSVLSLAHTMVNRAKETPAPEWQTWVLGVMISVMFLLLSWGYQSISSEIERNREMILELQRTGAIPVREALAGHEARLDALEKATEQNFADHQRIIADLQIIRDRIIKPTR